MERVRTQIHVGPKREHLERTKRARRHSTLPAAALNTFKEIKFKTFVIEEIWGQITLRSVQNSRPRLMCTKSLTLQIKRRVISRCKGKSSPEGDADQRQMQRSEVECAASKNT